MFNRLYTDLNATLARLEHEGRAKLQADGFKPEEIVVERSMEMRYVGQVHECNVAISNDIINDASMHTILRDFHLRHEALFTYSEPQSVVELVNVEVMVRGQVEKPHIAPIAASTQAASKAIVAHRPMILSHQYEWEDTPVYNGSALGAGDVIAGPAIIQEPTTTLLLKKGWQANLHTSGTYHLTKAA